MIKSNLFKKSCVAVSLFSYLVSSTFAAIPTMTVEYDAAGNVSKQTAGNGQAHSYGYDIAGNVTSYSSPGVGSASFEYGPESLSKFTDFKGLNTTYQMDKLTGQIESITSPDTGTTSFTYDQAGNVISALTPAGVTFSFTYDALNRATSASFGDETINYSYYSYGTAKGELASIQDSTGSTGFNYNAQGLPLSKTQTTTGAGGGSGASLGYLKTWAAGQLSSLRYPSGKTISYTYDAERITSISLNGTVIISNITYSANGAPVSWQMGGTGTYSRSYDSYGRMVSYSIDGTAKAVGWDENNRVSSIDYASGTSSFGYDAADRLTSASGGPHAGSGYAYDANGNKTSVTVAGANYGATVDPGSNRILTFTAPGIARSYSYDNKGNTVGDGTRTYSWSNTNKLLSATNGTTTAYYGYNGFGQRVKKVVGQAARYYFYDDDGYSLLGEYFQTTPGAPVGTVYETVYLEGIPVAVLKGSSVYYIQPDHLNTPRIIRDASGVLVWKWDSDLYGKGLANQNPGGVSLFEFNIRFPGQVFDSETGLHYNMARYYDPEIGRYTSSDPIGLGGGINTYEYVAGNPTGAVDPFGFFGVRDALGFVPVVGSLLDSYDNIKCGNYGFAALNAGLAIVDLTGAGAIVKGVTVGTMKWGSRKAIKQIYRDTSNWNEMRVELQKIGEIPRNSRAIPNRDWLTTDHVFIKQRFNLPHYMTNHPANLQINVPKYLNSRFERMNFMERAVYLPVWMKLGAAGLASYIGGIALSSNCECSKTER